MRSPTSVSLFPFLSVLVSTMGVLSFMGVAFLLLAHQGKQTEALPPTEIHWIGAPPHVKPWLMGCAGAGLEVHHEENTTLFSFAELQKELTQVEAWDNQLLAKNPWLGKSARREHLRKRIESAPTFQRSFSARVLAMEKQNKTRQTRQKLHQYYPLLLVYPQGVGACQHTTVLIQTISSLAVGMEPMLKQWPRPYQKEAERR